MSTRDHRTHDDSNLRSYPWRGMYKTTITLIHGRPLDILNDFYIPALSRAVTYDRVAGYFSSSSLAAASQGFSAIARRGGKIRMIVGADISPRDVEAVLAGDQQRLTHRLTDELDNPYEWPDDVHDGVTLLSWMVKHRHLEMKVAFRIHGKTREPMDIDSREDGYVHEKWFIMTDEEGNRLYGSGALNESRNSLTHNAENLNVHCDWLSESDRERVDEAALGFERLWAGEISHIRVMSLPEAVRQRMIRIARSASVLREIDGQEVSIPEPIRPSAKELLQFAVIRDAPRMPNGRYVGLETAPVEPWPHQRIVARRLIDSWPYSYLLCDEVGLGKTIEAGLVFRSLYLSGIVRRILVAAPASLTKQWHRQMASKLLLPFARTLSGSNPQHEYALPAEETRLSNSIYEPDLNIISTGLLARKERRPALEQSQGFDIALVDEAHNARRRDPTRSTASAASYGHLYNRIRDVLRPKATSLLLATATPMQIDSVEVCDLLALTNRVGHFQYDPTLTLEYYRILDTISRNGHVPADDWDFLKRSVESVQYQDPLYWSFLNDSVVDGRLRIPMRQWLERDRIPSGNDVRPVLKLIYSAAPLARVMLRHTRDLLEIYRDRGKLGQNLAKRHILPVPRITFTEDEQHTYDLLESYCKGLNEQIRLHGDTQARNAMGFFLSFLRLRFASSQYAIEQTLKRRLDKVLATLEYQVSLDEPDNGGDHVALSDATFAYEEEDDQVPVESLLKDRTTEDLQWERDKLKELISVATGNTQDSSKMRELYGVLDRRTMLDNERIRRTVIFTRFYDTLTDIVHRLRRVKPHMRIGTYSGKGGAFFDTDQGRMRSIDRDEVKELFLRDEIDVLVCTDAAAEGLNLQTADLLVNYDLGWNPMKVEQRIGRIDRIGQLHSDIYVLNLCYTGSAEEIVYNRLLTRLIDINLIVGTQQFSLLPVTYEDFEALADGSITEEHLASMARIRMAEQKERSASMEIPPDDLYEIYSRLSVDYDSPVNLDSIWDAISGSEYLRNLGCTPVGDPHDRLMRLQGIGGVPDGTFITGSRKLYETGIQGVDDLHFASYGDPVFEAIVQQFEGFPAPGCFRRISVDSRSNHETAVAYGVKASIGDASTAMIRLVTCWKDLDDLEMSEDLALTDDDARSVREQLVSIISREFSPSKQVLTKLEHENIRYGIAQQVLSMLVGKNLLEDRASVSSDGAHFNRVLEEISSIFENRGSVRVQGLPSHILRLIEQDIVFQCDVPKTQTHAQTRVTRVLGASALDALRRTADDMRIRSSDLTVARVSARVDRRVEERLRHMP